MSADQCNIITRDIVFSFCYYFLTILRWYQFIIREQKLSITTVVDIWRERGWFVVLALRTSAVFMYIYPIWKELWTGSQIQFNSLSAPAQHVNCEEYDASLSRRIEEMESSPDDLGGQRHRALLLWTRRTQRSCGESGLSLNTFCASSLLVSRTILVQTSHMLFTAWHTDCKGISFEIFH